MNDSNRNNPDRDQWLTAPVPESEILIGRMIDGELSFADRQRFENLAAADPALWRRLALRQQDMSVLAQHVHSTLSAADRIELPAETIHSNPSPMRAGPRTHSWGRVWAVSGWAAMFALAAVWGLTTVMNGRMNQGSRDSISLPASDRGVHIQTLSPDDHLREYLKAPFVVNEMPPTLLQVEELSDGRRALRMLRRIEEIAFVEPEVELPVDADGQMTKPPSEIRKGASAMAPQQY